MTQKNVFQREKQRMGYFREDLLQELCVLPCQQWKQCPYLYDEYAGREIEGMPFIADDPRSCPKCGHICPEFMGSFGFSPEDLEIRALLHCGGLLELLAELGRIDKNSDEYYQFQEKYQVTLKRYPLAEFPQYYWCLLHPLNQSPYPSLS
jgi:hypothetical protein